jgi:hypothetical protein
MEQLCPSGSDLDIKVRRRKPLKLSALSDGAADHSALDTEVFAENKNAPAAKLPERFEIYWPSLADLRAQESAVIFYAHLAAAE